MELKKNLVFLGMMGSGKSSIGVLISKKLKCNFVDTDNEIEKISKMRISNIFVKKGEKYFRSLEEKVVLKSIQQKNLVISLGGGAFINNNIRKEILSKHYSFWLNWKDEIIVSRIKNSKKRPIVSKLSDKEIVELIEKRSKIYSKAMFKIDCDNLTKSEIVNKIIKIYEQI
tara:strand:+ start:271 stop:783 length:513 start_codon:yes stop_codon:yes gene_type:complete